LTCSASASLTTSLQKQKKKVRAKKQQNKKCRKLTILVEVIAFVLPKIPLHLSLPSFYTLVMGLCGPIGQAYSPLGGPREIYIG